MLLGKQAMLLILMAIISTAKVDAKGLVEKNGCNQHELFKQWFAVDFDQTINFSKDKNEKSVDRYEFSFVSDDGQIVNGVIANHSNQPENHKLALLMHPMGSDQYFWWNEGSSPLPVFKLVKNLRSQGYTVITIDARLHGKRSRENFGARELLKNAHSNSPRIYIETITGSVRDYRTILNWAKNEYQPVETLVMGYSMGAQMAILLAGFEPSINKVISMVPPYVASETSPVAPRNHAERIDAADLLFLAGNKDPYSTSQQTEQTFKRIASKNKQLNWFDSGHMLPEEFIDDVLVFLNKTADQQEH